MIRVVPFGAVDGFSDQPIPGTHYYSQGFTPSLLGAATAFSIINKRDSTTVAGMGTPVCFTSALGKVFVMDNNGNILVEGTPGTYNFSIAHSTGGAGQFGLMGDQYGNLFYSAGSSPTQLGMYDGSSWNDSFKTALNAANHPMDWYEDLRLFGNGSAVACLFSDGTWNNVAFQLPANMTISCIRSGPTGILIGANLGSQGALIVWDGNSLRSKYPWKWTQGAILSIDRYGDSWIVRTQREVLITNGVTVKQLFGTLDDPLGIAGYDVDETFPQSMTPINNTLIFEVAVRNNNGVQQQFGRLKPGLYFYNLATRGWAYLPVPTGNTISVNVASIFADVNYNNRLLVGYTDLKSTVSYIAEIVNASASQAMFVSEVVGLGRIKYQRVFFGPTDKSLEAVILNVGILNSSVLPATQSFNVTLKVYNFDRQLWGAQKTNASLTNHAQLQVNGASTSLYHAQVGDEVTILEGVNAGQIAHITSIANGGSGTETWTLDTTLTGQTENSINLQVQPFVKVTTRAVTNPQTMNRIYFDVNKGIRGKQFLLKFLFTDIATNMQIEMQTSYWVFDDLGYDQT